MPSSTKSQKFYNLEIFNALNNLQSIFWRFENQQFSDAMNGHHVEKLAAQGG